MKNDSFKRNESLNEMNNIVILKSGGAAAGSPEKKRKGMSKDNRNFLKDLAVMAIISALVMAALIIYELLK